MIAIRKADMADREGICRVHVAAIRGLCSTRYSAEQITAWSGLLEPNSYNEVLRTRDMLVACDEQHIVGFGQLNRTAAAIEAVYVDPAYVHRGIGSAILARLHEIAAAAGFGSLHLCATLNAVGFYQRNGYRVRRNTVYPITEFLVLDCVEMETALPQSSTAAQARRAGQD